MHARRMEIDIVVSQHETDTLVLAKFFAKCLAAPRIVSGDLMRTARLPKPAHAVRQTRRR